jgi:hypothetical protein
MKKIYTLVILVVVMTMFTSMTAFAGSSSPKIKVTVNNKTVKYDVSPYITKGEVMIPVKQTAEAFGAEVEWDKENKTTWINYDMMHVELIVGKSEFYIHRDADFSGIPQTVKLKTTIKSIRGSVLVPGETVFESMGKKVSWDSKKRVLSITEEDTNLKDITYTELHKEDVSHLKEVNSWYNKNYTKAGVHYIKQDGVLYVLVGAGKKPTGGYTMGISRISYTTTTKAKVYAYLKTPSPDMMVTQVETFPHMLLKIEGHKKLRSVGGEIKEITSEPLPTTVPYEEITFDHIKDNCLLTNWYNKNNEKHGISSIRSGGYIYALIGGGERPTGGFTIHIDNIFYSTNETVTINASVTPPGDNVRVMMVITYPSTLIRIKSNTIKTIVGEVIDAKTPSKEKWVTMDSNTVKTMEIFTIDQVKLRDVTGTEKEAIMKSFNEATIDQNPYIEMITGAMLKSTTNDGYTITFTSYGSETNVIANFEKDGDTRTFHLVAPAIAKMLLQK